MEGIDLKSMPLDKLWALHETICSVLARKLEAEKRSHEQRLNELRLVQKGLQRDPPSVDPIQRSIQTFEILNRPPKTGPVVATSHVRCANGLRPEKASMVFAFTKSFRANRPAGFFVRE